MATAMASAMAMAMPMAANGTSGDWLEVEPGSIPGVALRIVHTVEEELL